MNEQDLALERRKQAKEEYKEVVLKLGKDKRPLFVLREYLTPGDNRNVKYDIYGNIDGESLLLVSIYENGARELNKNLLHFSKEEQGDLINLLGLEKDIVDLSKFKKQIEEIEKNREEGKEGKEETEEKYDNLGTEEKKKDRKDSSQDKNNEKEVDAEQIAQEENVPAKNVKVIRKDSQIFENHPELRDEPNLHLVRDNDGVWRAKYIDKDGNRKESKYIKPSTTHVGKPGVNLGKDGSDIKKDRAYQEMATEGLTRENGSFRDVRLSIYNDENGETKFSESRLGYNGEWTEFGIEFTREDYNTHLINELSNQRTNPEVVEETDKRHEIAKKTSLADDGIQTPDLSKEATIQRFIDEDNYQRPEAVKIYNYMVKDKMSEEKAKEEVNKEIRNRDEGGNGEYGGGTNSGTTRPSGGRSREEEADPYSNRRY